jgi:hypothetical protein
MAEVRYHPVSCPGCLSREIYFRIFLEPEFSEIRKSQSEKFMGILSAMFWTHIFCKK